MTDPIWEELKTFKVGQGNEKLSFIQRLARENHWSTAYAERVFHEYRKFIYMAKVSGRQVTPSDEVDQAWHLHLCYSDSYWNDLCRDMLKAPLHHGPTKGGTSERTRYWDQYEHTLAFYESCFGEAPPRDIWPTPKQRFTGVDRFIRVNRNDYFVIPKKVVIGGACATGLGLIASGCNDEVSNFLRGPGIIIGFMIGLIILGVILNRFSG
ncbi:MAG: TIGR04222 domain-containing membrane protein, partial [Verrucomicrobiota bacterium]